MMRPPSRANTPQPHNTSAPSLAQHAKSYVVDNRDLSIFLEVMKLEHFGDALIMNGFTIDNLHCLTASDLDKLRVTNKRERSCLLGAANLLKEEANLDPPERAERRRNRAQMVRKFKRTVGPHERRLAAKALAQEKREESGLGPANTSSSGGVVMNMNADGSVQMMLSDESNAEPDIPPFTATLATANEYARQAAIFLAHHRVDRPWPKAGSKLSQSLHLSGAQAPSYEPLYKINLEGEKTTVCPPHKHSQGMSAKFCKTCADFVSEAMQGAWQYQVIETVLIGEGLTEQVPVWKPFSQTESMKIEYAHKRQTPTVKVGKHMVNFATNAWGAKPIRRVDTDCVAFPTLKRKDLVTAPPPDLEPQREIATSIQALQRTLVSETEERRSRLFIEQQEQKGLEQVLAEIAAIMAEYHREQRAAVEAEEEIERAKWELGEFEKALDKLYEWEEQSVRDVALRKWERESERIMANQAALLEDMERVARRDVEREEEAFRKNLDKLVSMFNDQIREHLDRKRQKELRNKANGEGQPRCPVCRKFDCDFFMHPWRGQWTHHGQVAAAARHKSDDASDDEGGHHQSRRPQSAPGAIGPDKEETLSTLANRANEKEYQEYLLNTKVARAERKAKRRLNEYINTSRPLLREGPSPSPVSMMDDSHAQNSVGGGEIPGNTVHQSVGRGEASVEEIQRDDITADRTASHSPNQSGRPPTPSGMGTSRSRSPTKQQALHGNQVFMSAVGQSRHVTPDSVNMITKQSPYRVAKPVVR